MPKLPMCDPSVHAGVNICDDVMLNNCHEDAQCEGTVDSYLCICKTGYNGTGTFCEGTVCN